MRLVSLLVGAGLMYFFDPSNGIRRRQWLRDQWVSLYSAVTSFREMLQGSEQDAPEAEFHSPDPAILNDDWDKALLARIEEVLEQQVSSPHSIKVKIKDSVITLSGSALLSEIALVMEGVNTLPGVNHVENRIKVRQPTSDLADGSLNAGDVNTLDSDTPHTTP